MSTYSISELLSIDSTRLGRGLSLLKAATHLGMPIPELETLVASYGAGHIYAPTGLVLPDRPGNRYVMTRDFRKVVVLRQDGSWFCRSVRAIGYQNRQEKARRDKRDRDLEQRALLSLQEPSHVTTFRTCQESRPVRHGGKGNTHECIGRYIDHKTPDFETATARKGRSVKFQTINVPL